MAIKRITISVPEQVAKKIKKAAGDQSVSAWLTELALERLNDDELERQWEAFYADVAPTDAEKREAEASVARLLGPAKVARPRRRGAA